MKRTLFAHQEAALEYAKTRRTIALFMEMRLGKSLVALRWSAHHELERVLVVGPLSVLPGWEYELNEEGMGPVYWIRGPKKQRLDVARGVRGYFLVNYESLLHTPELVKMNWDGVIADESTRLRNPKAKITKIFTRKLYAPYRAILSGLPAPESPLDYFTQMHWISERGLFMGVSNFWEFRKRYFIPEDERGWTWCPAKGTRQAIKEEVHRQAFVLTRKDAKVGSRKIYETRFVEPNTDQLRYMEQIKKEFRFEELETKFAATQFLWLARVAGGFSPDQENPVYVADNKVREVVDLLQGELKGEPVVIWFRFNEELAAVYHRLKREGFKVGAILGATPSPVRETRRLAFMAGKTQVICVQLKCGKYGLNLSRADTAIYYSNSYDMEDRAQSEDRIVHPTKQRPLLYLDLITRGTADEAVVETLREKNIEARRFMAALWGRVVRNLHDQAH